MFRNLAECGLGRVRQEVTFDEDWLNEDGSFWY